MAVETDGIHMNEQICVTVTVCIALSRFSKFAGAPCGTGAIPLLSSLPHILLYLLVSFTFPFSLSDLPIFLLFHPFLFYQNNPTPFPGRMS